MRSSLGEGENTIGIAILPMCPLLLFLTLSPSSSSFSSFLLFWLPCNWSHLLCNFNLRIQLFSLEHLFILKMKYTCLYLDRAFGINKHVCQYQSKVRLGSKNHREECKQCFRSFQIRKVLSDKMAFEQRSCICIYTHIYMYRYTCMCVYMCVTHTIHTITQCPRATHMVSTYIHI